MQPDIAILVIILTAMVMGTVIVLELVKTWREARRPHIEDGGGRGVALLASENAGMKGQMSRLEERIAVLEQIATDPAHRTARAIEELR
jgi:hypothetical protein